MGSGDHEPMSPGLLRISRAMKDDFPVFIVGETRSGTSILYRTLQKHTSFSPKTTDLTETEIPALLRRVFTFNRHYPEHLMRYMLYDRDRWLRFLRTIRPCKAMNLLLMPANVLTRTPPAWLWYANLHHLTLRSFFFYAQEARGCRRLVEKTPTNTLHLSNLKRTFPKCRFLYVHRHPIDVYASYLRRAEVDREARWAGITVGEFCERYERSTSFVLAWLNAGNDDLMMIRYEDFTLDPSACFRQVCRFLAEPFEESALVETRPDLGRWLGDPHLWGPIVSTTKRWTDYVSYGQARTIETRLAAIMERFGYEPYVS